MTRPPGSSGNHERLVEAVRRIPPVPARAEFRARLRDEFVRGGMRERRGGGSAARPNVTPMLVAAAAACIILLALVAAFLNAGPAWRVAAVTGAGAVRVDGRPVGLNELRTTVARLRPGAWLEVPEGLQVDLELPGIAVMQIVGASRVAVPGSPGRWFARSLTSSLEHGEIRVSTGPRFAGSRFTIATPETHARVTGTTFAVIRNREASCVCVLEGGVVMTSGRVTDTVHAGFRRSVFRDGRPPLLEDILPMETMKLTILREQADQRLRR